ncbi:MAG TPA: hypothetical protein VJI67_03965, partial [archaeon]|nr:hypothetical protein [archaeon]
AFLESFLEDARDHHADIQSSTRSYWEAADAFFHESGVFSSRCASFKESRDASSAERVLESFRVLSLRYSDWTASSATLLDALSRASTGYYLKLRFYGVELVKEEPAYNDWVELNALLSSDPAFYLNESNCDAFSLEGAGLLEQQLRVQCSLSRNSLYLESLFDEGFSSSESLSMKAAERVFGFYKSNQPAGWLESLWSAVSKNFGACSRECFTEIIKTVASKRISLNALFYPLKIVFGFVSDIAVKYVSSLGLSPKCRYYTAQDIQSYAISYYDELESSLEKALNELPPGHLVSAHNYLGSLNPFSLLQRHASLFSRVETNLLLVRESYQENKRLLRFELSQAQSKLAFFPGNAPSLSGSENEFLNSLLAGSEPKTLSGNSLVFSSVEDKKAALLAEVRGIEEKLNAFSDCGTESKPACFGVQLSWLKEARLKVGEISAALDSTPSLLLETAAKSCAALIGQQRRDFESFKKNGLENEGELKAFAQFTLERVSKLDGLHETDSFLFNSSGDDYSRLAHCRNAFNHHASFKAASASPGLESLLSELESCLSETRSEAMEWEAAGVALPHYLTQLSEVGESAPQQGIDPGLALLSALDNCENLNSSIKASVELSPVLAKANLSMQDLEPYIDLLNDKSPETTSAFSKALGKQKHEELLNVAQRLSSHSFNGEIVASSPSALKNALEALAELKTGLLPVIPVVLSELAGADHALEYALEKDDAANAGSDATGGVDAGAFLDGSSKLVSQIEDAEKLISSVGPQSKELASLKNSIAKAREKVSSLIDSGAFSDARAYADKARSKASEPLVSELVERESAKRLEELKKSLNESIGVFGDQKLGEKVSSLQRALLVPPRAFKTDYKPPIDDGLVESLKSFISPLSQSNAGVLASAGSGLESSSLSALRYLAENSFELPPKPVEIQRKTALVDEALSKLREDALRA